MSEQSSCFLCGYEWSKPKRPKKCPACGSENWHKVFQSEYERKIARKRRAAWEAALAATPDATQGERG